MILTCPACGTQYVVKDGAIPPGGRQVRCASCRHSWHQDPDDSDELAAADDSPEPVTDNNVPPSELSITPIETSDAGRGAEASELDHRVATSDNVAAETSDERVEHRDQGERPPEPPAVEDEFTPFAVGATDEPKRRSGAFGALIAIILIALAAFAFWYFAPVEWKARVGLAEATETPLQLMMTHSDRQPLASGNELLAISGRVINPTQEQQNVPPITAQLRDDAGKLVYSWTIAPPTPSLRAGASAPFYSAEVNVPAGGNELTVTLGTPKA